MSEFTGPFARNKFADPEKRHKEHIPSKRDSDLKQLMLSLVKEAAAGRNTSQRYKTLEKSYKQSSLPDSYERVYISIYAGNSNRILVTRPFSSGKWSFATVFDRALKHKRIRQLRNKDCYIQLDFVADPAIEIGFYRVGMKLSGAAHFEMGIDGLCITGKDSKKHHFLPGDAYVHSIMSMKQLRTHLHDKLGEDYVRSARVERFRCDSFLLYDEDLTPLYRGLPRVGKIDKPKIESIVIDAIDNVKRNQRADGRFLYYYDPSQDSYRDFEHPNRDPKKNPYYNILRHSGGGLTCVFFEKYFKQEHTLENITRAIDFLVSQTVFYDLNGRQAGYIYSERKSKLGGVGLALYLVAEYQLLTKDTRYHDYCTSLALHTDSQITETGEFIYYNIYLDREIGAAENHNYFSFYYPGEALCGLARYLYLIPEEKREYYLGRIKLALDFLIKVRPITRASEYSSLPSDSWLMIAIMELWDFESMRDPAYSDFVISDATKMIGKMYKVTDAPFPDYAGAFYYDFGDYPYSDGARMEGLMAAYELAVKMDNLEIETNLWRALQLGSWSIAHLANTPAALYAAKNPEIAAGGIRFKYTRQWFRIDTIQHVAGFFAKLLPYWDRAVSKGYAL